MRRRVSLLALGLWLVSLLCPTMSDEGPGVRVLLGSLGGALYLWTLPWVFLNVGLLLLVWRGIQGTDSRQFSIGFLWVLGLVSVLELVVQIVVVVSGQQGPFQVGALVWTTAMALAGWSGTLKESRIA